MSEETATKGSEPLWLLLERKIRDLSESDVEGGNSEGTIQRIARELDETGYNVARHGRQHDAASERRRSTGGGRKTSAR